MIRLALFLGLWAIIFASNLYLLSSVVGSPAESAALWWAWYVAGAATLLSTALECSRLLVFLFAPGSSIQSPAPKDNHPESESFVTCNRLAMVIPANHEVSSEEDFQKFLERLLSWCDLIHRSKGMNRLFVLFDTRPDGSDEQSVRERELIHEANRLNQLAGIQVECEYREYRDKPKARRNKPGSIELFLEQEDGNFDLILILDADSRPGRSCDLVNTSNAPTALEQIREPFEQEPGLAMLQCGIRIENESTLIGWYQSVNAQIAEGYFEPVENLIGPKQRPSYGHHVVFRWKALKEIYDTGVPQSFLSHDFVEAALLASQGWKCKSHSGVAFVEQAEEGVMPYLKRDVRWQRGNCQWLDLLASHRKTLPLAARYFLQMGWLSYAIPLVGIVFLVLSALLVANGNHLASKADSAESRLLVSIVILGLVGPKLGLWLRRKSVRPRFRTLLGHALIGILICPPLAIYSAWYFLLAPLKNTRWNQRMGRAMMSRRTEWLDCFRKQLPFSAFAALLLAIVIESGPEMEIGSRLVISILLLIIAGPLTLSIASLRLVPGAGTQTTVSTNRS